MMDTQRYLDNKLPSFASLCNLDAETDVVKQRSEALTKEIEQERAAALAASTQASTQLGEHFKSIDKSMLEAVPSEREFHHILSAVSAELKRNVKEKFKGLQTLSKGHQVITRLKTLRKGCQEIPDALNESLDKAMSIYNNLLDVEYGLGVFSKSSNPAIALLAQKGLDEFKRSIRKPVQDQCATNMRKLLEDSQWPKAAPTPKTFIPVFANMLRAEKPTDTSPSRPQPLRAFSVLCEQYDIRFKFHFESNRETSRLDKPEWAFEHFKSTIEEQLSFLDSHAKPAMAQVDRFSDRSAVTEFITAMLPSVYRMLKTNFVRVREQSPNLMSHFIYQCCQFDQMLQRADDGFCYVPYGRDSWRGLTGDLLARENYFDEWLVVERENALVRYKEIVEIGKAFEIDFEGVDAGETKPTYSAVNLKDLMEGITERYKYLSSVNYRLRFLLEIQIDILDKYYNRLQEAIDAFDSMSSTLARSIGGASAEDQKRVQGLNGIEQLCRLYGSAEYMRSSLESWGQELFFLTLWDDISRLSAKNKKLDTAASNAIAETATSNIPNDEEEEGTLFDETMASYDGLKTRLMSTLKGLLQKEMRHALSNYVRSTDWQIRSGGGSDVHKLATPIKKMSKELDYLRKFHNSNDFSRLSKTFSSELERYLWNNLVQANSFSPLGGQQLSKDVMELWTQLQLLRDLPFKRLSQMCAVLSTDNVLKSTNATEVKESMELTALSVNQVHTLIERKSYV